MNTGPLKRPGPAAPVSRSHSRQRRLAHAAAQWEALQVLAAQGALPEQVAAVDTGDTHSVHSTLYHSFLHLLACSPGALRDNTWLQLLMPVLRKDFQVCTWLKGCAFLCPSCIPRAVCCRSSGCCCVAGWWGRSPPPTCPQPSVCPPLQNLRKAAPIIAQEDASSASFRQVLGGDLHRVSRMAQVWCTADRARLRGSQLPRAAKNRLEPLLRLVDIAHSLPASLFLLLAGGGAGGGGGHAGLHCAAAGRGRRPDRRLPKPPAAARPARADGQNTCLRQEGAHVAHIVPACMRASEQQGLWCGLRALHSSSSCSIDAASAALTPRTPPSLRSLGRWWSS